MTFQTYQRRWRLGQTFEDIRGGADLVSAGLEHGFDSSSGFREAFAQLFGAAPGRSRGSECIVTCPYHSPIGPLVLAATAEAVCLVEFAEPPRLRQQVARLEALHGRVVVPGSNAILERLEQQLSAYFGGSLRTFDVPLDDRGTPFQRQVWRGLRAIPYGQTLSYEELARRVGRPGAQRAVGSANGRNRLAIVIPCHRVVNKSGRLGGYGGGLWRKRHLLDLEQRHCSVETSPRAAGSDEASPQIHEQGRSPGVAV